MMTNQEAIKILGQYDVSDLHFYTTDGEEIPFTEWSDAIEMAIEALEKQIPEKPTIKQDRYNENLYALYCPTCGSYIGMYNKRLKMSDFFNNSNRNICNRCGQAIDCEVEA